MYTRLSQSLFEASIRSAYTRRFREKGAQAEGVFWASRLSQQARFEQVLQDMKLSLIHISEPTRHLRISYAVFCLKKKK